MTIEINNNCFTNGLPKYARQLIGTKHRSNLEFKDKTKVCLCARLTCQFIASVTSQ